MKMEDFDKEFIMDLFLESDSVSTLNRLVVAMANVVNENNENISMCNEFLKQEFKCHVTPEEPRTRARSYSRGSNTFFENVILHYGDSEYEEKFKMKRSTVQKLVDYLRENSRPGGMRVPLEKKVHIFIWLLTSGGSYSEVGALFGLHKSSVSYILHEIASLLAELRYDFIKWPTIDEQHVTRIKVNSRLNFPNCIGFIDVCWLKVGSKRNKKDEPEVVLLQGVCDESLKFIDIYLGEIGRTRKSRVYKESPLSRGLKNVVDFENHILGDSEYKLKKNLITPFTSDELLTSEEMKFNEMHWKTRAYIGRAFELLKERFRKLNHIDLNKPEAINTLVCAACVLHNFILRNEYGVEDVKVEMVSCDEGVIIDTSIVKSAAEKRQFLCNYVNYIDST